MTAVTQSLGEFDSFTPVWVERHAGLVHTFHEQAQALAAEPAGLSAGWPFPFAAQVPT